MIWNLVLVCFNVIVIFTQGYILVKNNDKHLKQLNAKYTCMQF